MAASSLARRRGAAGEDMQRSFGGISIYSGSSPVTSGPVGTGRRGAAGKYAAVGIEELVAVQAQVVGVEGMAGGDHGVLRDLLAAVRGGEPALE